MCVCTCVRVGEGAGPPQELTPDRPWSPHRQQDVESPTLAGKGPQRKCLLWGWEESPGSDPGPKGCFLGGVSCSDEH